MFFLSKPEGFIINLVANPFLLKKNTDKDFWVYRFFNFFRGEKRRKIHNSVQRNIHRTEEETLRMLYALENASLH